MRFHATVSPCSLCILRQQLCQRPQPGGAPYAVPDPLHPNVGAPGQGSARRRQEERADVPFAILQEPLELGAVGIIKLAYREGTSLDDGHTIDDPVKVYLAEVHKVPPLSRGEEIRCVQHVRAGDQQAESAGKRLVEANLHLVVSIAERYRNDRIHILDLIQKGNDGLMGALRTFSDSGEDSFSPYATARIERAIAEAVAFPDSSDV